MHTLTLHAKELGPLWSRWTIVMEQFARRDTDRLQIDPDNFAQLRHELVRLSRQLGSTGEESQQALGRKIEDLVSPWLTPEALEQTNREILFDLAERCQKIKQELTGQGRGLRLRIWFVLAAVLGMGIGLVSLMLRHGSGFWAAVNNGMFSTFRFLQWVFSPLGETLPLVLVGIGVVLVGMFIVSRTAKN